MLRQLHKDKRGFTIIEVLIVLAIAGLIMLIVFLAVPALQRNSRNTERRNEASRLLTSANEFVTNSNGAALTAGTGNANMATIHTSASVSSLSQPNFGASATAPGVNETRLVWQGRCNGNRATTGGTGRQIALEFGLEPAGTVACITM